MIAPLNDIEIAALLDSENYWDTIAALVAVFFLFLSFDGGASVVKKLYSLYVYNPRIWSLKAKKIFQERNNRRHSVCHWRLISLCKLHREWVSSRALDERASKIKKTTLNYCRSAVSWQLVGALFFIYCIIVCMYGKGEYVHRKCNLTDCIILRKVARQMHQGRLLTEPSPIVEKCFCCFCSEYHSYTFHEYCAHPQVFCAPKKVSNIGKPAHIFPAMRAENSLYI